MSKPDWKTKLPEWTEESPRTLHALFLRYQQDALSWDERELYAKHLVHVIAIKFNEKNYCESLPRAGIIVEDLKQDTLLHLLRKTRTMEIRAEGWRPMMKVLYQAVTYFVLTAIASKRGKLGKEISSTDFLKENKRRSGELPSPSVSHGFEVEESDLQELLGDVAEDVIMGDIPTKTAAEFAAVQEFYGIFRARLIAKVDSDYRKSVAKTSAEARQIPDAPDPPRHEDLPIHLQEAISLQQHGIITSRFYRVVRAVKHAA